MRTDRNRFVRCAFMVATAAACIMPASARAQRITRDALVSARVAAVHAPAAPSHAVSLVPIARDTSGAAETFSSNATGLGAIAGAIVGAAAGYAIGENCDGAGSQGGCRRTAIIGATVAGALLGAIAGQIIEAGEEYDARRAHPSADSATARSREPARPSS